MREAKIKQSEKVNEKNKEERGRARKKEKVCERERERGSEVRKVGKKRKMSDNRLDY